MKENIVIVLCLLGIIFLYFIYNRLVYIEDNTDFTAQQSVQIRDSVRGLPYNFKNNP